MKWEWNIVIKIPLRTSFKEIWGTHIIWKSTVGLAVLSDEYWLQLKPALAEFYNGVTVLCIACTVQYVCSFGRPVVKNLPSIARDVGLIPGQGTKIPHALEHLSPWATTK